MFVVKWDIRDLAPTGMMEYWNIGKIGLGVTLNLVNDAIQPAIKLIMNHVSLKTHYSIFPLFHYSF
jgi:hypothetical protein